MQPSARPFETQAVLSLASLYIVRMLGLFMVLPVLVLHSQAYLHSTPMLIGIAVGIYGLSQAILQIPFGVLSDRFGRKPMIFLGLSLFAAGSVVAASADTVYGLIAGRFLQGAGAIASVVMALLTDLTAAENRSRAMAVIGVSIGLSFTISLILGPVLDSLFGISGIFWVSACLALVGMAVLLLLVPAPVSNSSAANQTSMVTTVKSVLSHAGLIRWNVGIFALHFTLTALFVALPLILDNIADFSRESHWKVYLPTLLVAFVVMMPLMMAAERRGKLKGLFLAAITLIALSSFVIGIAPANLWVIAGALFLYFLAFNMMEVSLPSLMSKTAPESARGAASGVYSSSQFLGAFLGSVSAGMVSQWLSISLAIMVIPAIAIVCAIAIAFTSESAFSPESTGTH